MSKESEKASVIYLAAFQLWLVFFVLVGYQSMAHRDAKNTVGATNFAGIRYVRTQNELLLLLPTGEQSSLVGTNFEITYLGNISLIGFTAPDGTKHLFISNGKKHLVTPGLSIDTLDAVDLDKVVGYISPIIGTHQPAIAVIDLVTGRVISRIHSPIH